MDRRREPDRGRDGEDMHKVSDIGGPPRGVTREAGLGSSAQDTPLICVPRSPRRLVKAQPAGPLLPRAADSAGGGGPTNFMSDKVPGEADALK